MQKASVVIRTYNEGRHLRQTLSAVLAQRDVDVEMIVVDSGSDDDTLSIVGEFPVKLVKIDKAQFTYGRALNLGFAAATASFVACLSAHALPFDRHWLRNLLRPFVDERVDGVVGKTLPHPDCNPFDRRGLLRQYGTGARRLHEGGVPGFANANSAVRRDAWEDRPFDETLSFSEDALWARQRWGRGRAVAYAPDAVVYHSHNETPRQLVRRFWAESRARETLDPHNPRYRLRSLWWDVLAGTLYDVGTALRTRAGWRWLVFAPRRRLAINLGRFAGSRAMELPEHGSMTGALLRRWLLRLLRLGGSLAGRLAPRMVVMTRKHSRPIHPKHLLAERSDHFWYGDHLRGGTRALDVGCNVGAHANFVAKQGLAVVGFDVDPVALGHARFLLRWEDAPQALVVKARADRPFPVADSSFDRVLAFDIIEHLDEPAAMLSEIRRVLTDDGLLLLSAPKVDTPWKRRYRAAGLSFFADVDHRVEYTLDGLLKQMNEAGFNVVDRQPIVADTPLAPWYDLLGAINLRWYARLAERKRRAALADPQTSTGYRLVARKAVT